MTVAIIQGVVSFAFVVILMPSYIRLLRATGFGKRIVEEGPEAHMSKEGTPTMGGLLLIIVVLLLATVFGAWEPSTAPTLLALLGVGILGAVDDILNALTGVGIRGRHKIVWQGGGGRRRSPSKFSGSRIPRPASATSSSVRSVDRHRDSRSSGRNGGQPDQRAGRARGQDAHLRVPRVHAIAILNVPTQSNLASCARSCWTMSDSSGSTCTPRRSLWATPGRSRSGPRSPSPRS
jgi:hypothetical protein